MNRLYGSEQQVAGLGSVLPEDFDELSPQEEKYYQQGPFSTREDFLAAKGGRIGFKHGGSWADWMSNHSDQMTFEEYLQIDMDKPVHPIDKKSTGGRVYDTRKYFKPGGLVEPGVTHYATKDEITAEKKKKAVTEIWEKRSPRQKDLIAKKVQMQRAKTYLNTDAGKQLKWIADNGKNYENPQKMVTAFEKKFKTKLVKANLFTDIVPTAKGSKKMYGLKYLAHAGNDALIKGHNLDNMFQFIPGFSEEELFKASILQNNSKAYNKMKNVLKMVHRDVGLLQDKASLLTVEDALKTLGKSEYQYLKNFDLISATAAPGSGHMYGGIHRGILRETLRDKGINEQWMKSFQAIRTPLGSTDEIIQGLSSPGSTSLRKKWNVSLEEAKKIEDGWYKVSKGRYQAGKWIESVDKLLGKEGQFRKIFGNVHFDHILTKDFGRKFKDVAKLLPRDYLIQGKYSTAAFNQWKGVNFDKPLVRKIKAWKEAAPGSAKKLKFQGEVEDLIKRFNLATDNYFGSYKPSFEGDKFRWTETTQRSPFKDVHRYVKNPKLAEQELAKTALGFKNLGTQEFKGTKELIAKQNKFANLLREEIDNLDNATQKLLGQRLGCLSSGGRVMLGKGGVADCLKSKLKQNPKSFLQNIGQTAVKTKNSNILNFLKTGGNIARSTGLFAMWEAAFIPLVSGLMVPQGESGKRILYEATYGPILEAIGIPAPGISEKEEQIEYFGKSGYNVSRMNEIAAEYKNLQDQRNAEINKYAGVDYTGQKQFQIEDEMKKLQDEYMQISGTFQEGPAGGAGRLEQGIQDWMTGAEKLAAQKAQNLEAYKKIGGPDQVNLGFFPEGLAQFRNYNTGGRVAFGVGGIDKGRRAFMKWLAGLTGAGVAAGTGLIKWSKVAGKGKTAVKAGDHIIQSTQGMPDWFIPLINRIVKEGDDVTAKLATVEREIVHSKQISKGEHVDVYQNLDTGNVRVEYQSAHSEMPIHMEYKAPEEITSGKHAGKKTKSEFEAAESEPNWEVSGPDDADLAFDGENLVGKVDDLTTDTSKLKEYGKNKKLTIKEKIEAKKKQDYRKSLEHDSQTAADYLEGKHGPGPEPDDMDMFDEFGNYIGD
jgi:hypothetical protein